ncbi:hypothetical protein H4696_008649 [Amycolatopsis lexingtonensis]|uniref:Uncharacterized protein n=1 Tax=Amycolatopsis lexingtonensis TaxID=218822 RepID=A0ABR9IEF2_9PSEU|nr:hypothetical protein [Amycolatopsis lexingtonensis]MBE1501549.1 hypothetical protein [Amycolatopsis lexingtonensis]
MARKGEGSELPSVAELVNLSQTKPLMIRGELDAKLAEEPEPEPEPKPDPLAILDAELAAPEPDDERPRDAPPADTSRRTKPFILAAGGVVALGLAAVVLLQPHQVGGTAVPPPGASASVPPPTSSEAVETMSASAAPPPLTAEVHDSPAKKPSAPAGAGRKPAGPATTAAPPPDPQDQWREYVSSVISSWQQRPHGGRDR